MNPLLYPMTAQVVHPILYPHLYLVPPYVGRHLERGHLLTKMEVTVSGTFNRNGEDRDMTRTTVYEIKDVSSTKVEVPAEAKAKIGS